jgi:hypothetical protein
MPRPTVRTLRHLGDVLDPQDRIRLERLVLPHLNSAANLARWMSSRIREVLVLIGMLIGTVMSTLSRARERLRQTLTGAAGVSGTAAKEVS